MTWDQSIGISTEINYNGLNHYTRLVPNTTYHKRITDVSIREGDITC